MQNFSHLPPEVWATIFDISESREQAILRLVCKSACAGADGRRRHLSIDEDLCWRFNRNCPQCSEISIMMKKLTNLSLVFIRCHNKNSFLSAVNVLIEFAKSQNYYCVLRIAGIESQNRYQWKNREKSRNTLLDFIINVRKSCGLYLAWAFIELKNPSYNSQQLPLFDTPDYVQRVIH